MNTKKTLYMEATAIPVSRTIGEITARLVESGARAIRTEYDQNQNPVALAWSMAIYDRPVFFQMPAKVDPVFRYLRSRRKTLSRDQVKKLEEQAARVAWRQLLRWVEVQISLIDIGMVEYSQVFLAYRQEGEGGRTVWDVFQEQQFKALEAGAKAMKHS